MTTGLVIQTDRLGKSYGRVEALKELNLSIRAHGITAFLGLNGAGKSTTIKILLGMMRPSSGDGTILGQRISDPMAAHSSIATMICRQALRLWEALMWTMFWHSHLVI
jgi:ABC-type multidrug transport system ATPase subunit